jgi:hypothetical protein
MIRNTLLRIWRWFSMAAEDRKGNDKDKIQSIKWVIESFLEPDLTIAMLEKNPDQVEELGNGFRKHLLDRTFLRSVTESFDVVRLYEPSEWEEPEVQPLFGSADRTWPIENRTTPAQNIMRYYIELKPLWENLKSGIKANRATRMNYQKIEAVDIAVDLRFNRLTFKKDIYTKMLFISLLEGSPYSIFRECQAENCNKWYVSSHKNKKYCQPKCSVRDRQLRFRKNNPEKFKDYHREYQKRTYREKVLSKS